MLIRVFTTIFLSRDASIIIVTIYLKFGILAIKSDRNMKLLHFHDDIRGHQIVHFVHDNG